MRVKMFVRIASFMVCAVAAVSSLAQDFPSKPINFVVPFGAGGSPDVIARVIGKKLSENIGQPVVVVNRPGASGIIAARFVAGAPADGYTLFVASIHHLAINPHLYSKLPYDPLKDFVPVTMAVRTPLFIVVRADIPVNSVKELITYARSHPGMFFGSSGNGSQHQLGMELFKVKAGVKMTHVPYKGVAQSVPALLAGNTSLMLVALPSVKSYIKSGKVRIIAVAEAKRTDILPDVPTIAESGFPGYEISPEIGFVVGAGTPREVIAKLNEEIVKVLHDPEIAQRLLGMGIIAAGTTPEEFAESIRTNYEKYGELVKMSNAKVD